MKKKNLFDVLDRVNLAQEQTIELFYLLKAWKILSVKEIVDKSLKFNTFFTQKVESKKMLAIFEKLAKEHNVFKFYLNVSGSNLVKLDSYILVVLYNAVEDNELAMRVNDAFYTQKSIHNFSVSNQIAELGVKLLNNESECIYVPFSNGFAYAYETQSKVCAENENPKSAFISELIRIVDKRDIEFKLNDPLINPAYINSNAPHLLKQFKAVLSFPPFGMRVKQDFSHDKFNRFKIHKGMNLDVAHFEHILAQCAEKAVVLMPVGFSYRSGTEENFREFLIKNNLLEAVIQLPPNLHSATSIETTFFVINKQRTKEKVLFLNLKNEEFLTRDARKIVFKDVDNIIDIYINDKVINNISAIVPIEEIKNNNYSLAIDRYVVSQEAKELQEQLSSYKTVALEDMAEIRKSQLFKDEGEGKEVYELSPSDFSKAGFTKEGGKLKKIGSQDKKYETYKLQPYDVLVSTKGTIGKVAIMDAITKPILASQASQVIRTGDKEKAIVLYMFLKSNIGQAMLKQHVAGTSMPQIATSEIKKLKIPLLSKNEKKQVLLNFNNEIKMYNEINEIKSDIKQIHNNFLGHNR